MGDAVGDLVGCSVIFVEETFLGVVVTTNLALVIGMQATLWRGSHNPEVC